MSIDLVGADLWARANGETLTYILFFGLLSALGLLETIFPRTREPARRPVRWSVNAGLTALWIAAAALLPLSLLGSADFAAKEQFGLLHWTSTAPVMALIVGMLARSLVSYLTHVAMHKWPMLWRIHRVHHADPLLDISTTARFHPLEAIAAAPFAIAGVLIFGVPPLAVILYEILDVAIVVCTHANIRIPRRLDSALSLLLVTPNMHRIHHSVRLQESDSNYGATLAVWDRLFGTFRTRPESELADMKLGLEDVSPRRANSFLWLLVSPFLAFDGRVSEPVSCRSAEQNS